jgi:transposase
MATVTVLAGPERRRRWTTAEKLRIVEESLAGGASVAEVAPRNDVHANLLYLWRRQVRTGALSMAGDAGARFAPVAVVAAHAAMSAAERDVESRTTIEVVLRNGRVLRLSERVGLAGVARLADALEGQAR